jgi:hypothetical protein
MGNQPRKIFLNSRKKSNLNAFSKGFDRLPKQAFACKINR